MTETDSTPSRRQQRGTTTATQCAKIDYTQQVVYLVRRSVSDELFHDAHSNRLQQKVRVDTRHNNIRPNFEGAQDKTDQKEGKSNNATRLFKCRRRRVPFSLKEAGTAVRCNY